MPTPGQLRATVDAAAQNVSNIFERQTSIPLVIPPHVALVGCGGVGSWIGYLLALAGVSELTLFDSDEVSDSNLNRCPFGPDMRGKPKVEALRALIASVRPDDCKVNCWPNFAPEVSRLTHARHANWIAVSTDTWASRCMVRDWTVEMRSKYEYAPHYIEAAAEGEFGSISNAPAEWVTANEEQPGYASVPVWVGPSICAAMMACSHILHNTAVPDSARLGWLKPDGKSYSGKIEFSYRR